MPRDLSVHSNSDFTMEEMRPLTYIDNVSTVIASPNNPLMASFDFSLNNQEGDRFVVRAEKQVPSAISTRSD